ncbi:hypothetical protein IQ457_07315 [Psychrobacter sp. M9-54-1]|uniref:hypothetical protein n=1 Tax=Psychrobacter sp. M9-54-1 TaxID=2782386 RepID=UPI001909F7A7|nr:hypothetical protein [Psychrobacter sp. M9-54-1]MBK3393748.1 hypothetical protein [Psychrobacter sp. M9-54-1]
MSDIESIVEGFGEGIKPLLENLVSLDYANTFLVSVLVKHLIDEGVINLDKYLESNKHYEELLKEGFLKQGPESESAQQNVMMLEKTFAGHRNDLAKPE